MRILTVLSLSFLVFMSCSQPAKDADTKKEPEVAKNVVVENIMNRRSIRKYKPEQLAQAQWIQ